jgi:hypothetical protein
MAVQPGRDDARAEEHRDVCREVAVPGRGVEGVDRRRLRHAGRGCGGGLLRHCHLPRILQSHARRQTPLGVPQPRPRVGPTADRRGPRDREPAGRGVGRRRLRLGVGGGRRRLLRRHRWLDVLPRSPHRRRAVEGRHPRRGFPGRLLQQRPDGVADHGRRQGRLRRRHARTALRRHPGLQGLHRPGIPSGARSGERQDRLEA